MFEIYKEVDPDLIELTRTDVDINGDPTSQKYVYPQQGGEAEIMGGPFKDLPGGKSIGIFVAPGEWYTTLLIGGRQAMLTHKIISEDEKMMHMKYKRFRPQGEYSEETQVFVKQ